MILPANFNKVMAGKTISHPKICEYAGSLGECGSGQTIPGSDLPRINRTRIRSSKIKRIRTSRKNRIRYSEEKKPGSDVREKNGIQIRTSKNRI